MRFRQSGQNPKAFQYWMNAFHGRIPESALAHIAGLLSEHPVEFHLSRPRVTKLGHYRSAHSGKPHLISVNSDLSPARFLLTLVHEIAHLKTYVEYGRGVKPHGLEWKRSFQEAMIPLLNEDVFPSSILPLIKEHLYSPKASSCSDPVLHKAFEKMEGRISLSLNEIPEGVEFSLRNGRTFIKGIKKRTRFLCLDPVSGRKYLVHGTAEISRYDMVKSL